MQLYLSLGSRAGGNCVNGWRSHCFYAVMTCHPNIPSFTKQELRASCQLGTCTELNWKEVEGCFWVALLWFLIWSTSTLWYWQLTWAAHFFASTKLHPSNISGFVRAPGFNGMTSLEQPYILQLRQYWAAAVCKWPKPLLASRLQFDKPNLRQISTSSVERSSSPCC